MGKNKGPIFRTLPPAQGGGIGHQGEVPNGLHAIHREAVLEGHRPLPQWAETLQHGSNRGATTMDWWFNRATSIGAPLDQGPAAQVAPGDP